MSVHFNLKCTVAKESTEDIEYRICWRALDVVANF